jgi:hypothetical protein
VEQVYNELLTAVSTERNPQASSARDSQMQGQQDAKPVWKMIEKKFAAANIHPGLTKKLLF